MPNDRIAYKHRCENLTSYVLLFISNVGSYTAWFIVCAITVLLLCLIYLHVNLFAWCSGLDKWNPCPFFTENHHRKRSWYIENGHIKSTLPMNTPNSSRLCESVLGTTHATCFKKAPIAKCHLEWFNDMRKNHTTSSFRYEEGNIFLWIW
jgi:hypothetical protein